MSGAGVYVMTEGGLVAAATVPGEKGSQGQSPTIAVGTVTTGAAGSSASATITGTTPNLSMALTIPKGDPGGWVSASTISPRAALDTIATPGLYYRGRSVRITQRDTIRWMLRPDIWKSSVRPEHR